MTTSVTAANIKAGDVVEMPKCFEGKLVSNVTLEIADVRVKKNGHKEIRYAGLKQWLAIYEHTIFNVVNH